MLKKKPFKGLPFANKMFSRILNELSKYPIDSRDSGFEWTAFVKELINSLDRIKSEARRKINE